ncbi:DUF3027 domain-containing protein [Klenkia soli]|uniref:DUF3027 domain-containing protein n=1 Tax=Klenkia soli TaxID=1052260 RepID=UPI001F621C17|nr:DUF3027 domain-containing protein [Klenkia soli]
MPAPDPAPVTAPATPSVDVLTAAVETARAAAVEVAGLAAEVGEHLGTSREAVPDPDVLGEVLTHTFAASLPGYVGWHWAVTLAHVPGDEHVTVDEVVLLPGDSALLAPSWVPWHERIRPGDLSVGDVLPVTEDDPRLVPAYLADDDSAADPAGMVVAQEIGIGRERVLSVEGRREALARWSSGEWGPTAAIARHAPGSCGDCGFLMPLAGSVRLELGVCANAYAPADGHVVTTDHGCGAHSEASVVPVDTTEIQLTPLYNTDTYDAL